MKQPLRTRIIVGLGNPGPEYTNTRHNIGFRIIDRLAEKLDIKFDTNLGKNRVAVTVMNGITVILVKPQTFMNLSGRLVKSLVDSTGFEDYENMLVVHDDADLEWGRISLKLGGSSAGHRGVGSIIDNLGTDRFSRIRIGIGHPASGKLADYVLGNMTGEEERDFPKILVNAVKIIVYFLNHGYLATVEEFSKNTYCFF